MGTTTQPNEPSPAADVEKAARLGRTRARLFMVQGALFLGWQGFYLQGGVDDYRTVTTVKISAWLVWAAMLLILLATGGMLLRGRKVRHLLFDELTRQHRSAAFAYGFWAAALSCIGLYFLTMFEPVAGREAIHIVLSCSIAAALMRFALLERRSAV